MHLWSAAGVEDRRNSSSMRLYTPVQMRALFERQGLIAEQLHKSIRFDAYGPSAPRMIIVGRKAPARAKTVPRMGAGRYGQRQIQRQGRAAPVVDLHDGEDHAISKAHKGLIQP